MNTCPTCKEEFTYKANLVKHIRDKHGKKLVKHKQEGRKC